MTLTDYEQWVANSVGALVNAADPMEMMRAVKNAPAERRYMTLLSFARVAPATAPASSVNVGGDAGAGNGGVAVSEEKAKAPTVTPVVDEVSDDDEFDGIDIFG